MKKTRRNMHFDYLIYLYGLRNFRNGFIWWINNLLQKGIRYKHHHHNYEAGLSSGLIPSGSHLKKSPAFEPVREDFNLKWDQVLWRRKKTCEITPTWILRSYCKHWIGYCQWGRKLYRWNYSKVKKTVHKTQKLRERIGERENKKMDKSERSR